MPSTSMALHHRQQQGLSPRLQHAVRLLQMSSLDFAQEVRNVLGRNPFLEGESSGAEYEEGESGSDAEESAGSDDTREKRTEQEAWGETDSYDPLPVWGEQTAASQQRPDDIGAPSMDSQAFQPTLRDHLHVQLNVLPLSERDQIVASVLVESLDDDGYLRLPLEEVGLVCDLSPEVSTEELRIALRRVQALEPAGVGARSVSECLLLQLPAIECEQQRRRAKLILEGYMDRLAARDIPALSKALACCPAVAEATCDRIRRLSPRPGWKYGSAHAQYLTPDVIVRKTKRGAWRAELNPLVAPRVRLNKVYAEMYQRHRAANAEASNTELTSQLQDAQWTVRNVEQRMATILSVAQAIVGRQGHFFEFGPMAMKPLGLREVAEEVGVHESTVSRVTNNKYMATPAGVFELKHFFSRAMTSTSGSKFSGTAIKGLIQDMLSTEKPQSPLSDAEIARQLKRQGLAVARRTVTKYRQLMKIEPVERRRRHGLDG